MAAQQLPLKVLQTDVAKDSARWTKKAFREGLVAPAVKGSDAPVTAFVKATPGAVGCVAGPSSGVKVLQTYGVPPRPPPRGVRFTPQRPSLAHAPRRSGRWPD